jgi:hypothetical protein
VWKMKIKKDEEGNNESEYSEKEKKGYKLADSEETGYMLVDVERKVKYVVLVVHEQEKYYLEGNWEAEDDYCELEEELQMKGYYKTWKNWEGEKILVTNSNFDDTRTYCSKDGDSKEHLAN